MSRNLCVIVAVMILAPLIAQAQDHPLLTRYPGSRVESNTSKEFAQYKLVTAFDQKTNGFSGPTLEGKVTRLIHGNPAQRSPLEIFRNYQSSLTQAGMETLFQCAGEQCGPTFSASAWNRYNGVIAFSGKDSHYLAGKLKTANAEAFVALMVGKQRTQIHIVERKAMDAGLVTVNAEALAASLAREGKVSIYGIYFDTNKAELKSESKPTLDEIALLLKQKTGIKTSHCRPHRQHRYICDEHAIVKRSRCRGRRRVNERLRDCRESPRGARRWAARACGYQCKRRRAQ